MPPTTVVRVVLGGCRFNRPPNIRNRSRVDFEATNLASRRRRISKVSGVSSDCEMWVLPVSRVQPRRTVLVSALKLDLLTTRFVSRRSHPPDMAVPLGLQSRESGWSREEDDVGAVVDGGNFA